jgi:hypothetical protein
MKATDGLIQGLEETIKATVSKVEETEATVGELEAALQDKYPNMELAKHRFTARTYGSNPTPERYAPPQASLRSVRTVGPPLPFCHCIPRAFRSVHRAVLLGAPLPQPYSLTAGGGGARIVGSSPQSELMADLVHQSLRNEYNYLDRASQLLYDRIHQVHMEVEFLKKTVVQLQDDLADKKAHAAIDGKVEAEVCGMCA